MQYHMLTALALIAPLTAQDNKLGKFIPEEHNAYVQFDVEAMRDVGIWDALSRSPIFGMASEGFVGTMGCELDDLHRVDMYMHMGAERGSDQRMVVMMHGDKGVGDTTQVEGIEDMELGDRKVGRTESYRENNLYYSPAAGSLLYGAESLLQPMLAGDKKGSVLDPDLQSLSVQRGMLMSYSTHLTEWMRNDLPPFLKREWFDEKDPLEMMSLRFFRLPEPAEENMPIRGEMILRLTSGKSADQLIAGLKSGIESLKKDRQLGALKKVWNDMKVEANGRDVVTSISWDRARDASAHLTTLVMFGMMGTSNVEVAPPQGAGGPVMIEKVEAVEVKPVKDPDAKGTGEQKTGRKKTGGKTR